MSLLLLASAPAGDPTPVGVPGDPPNVVGLAVTATSSTSLTVQWPGIHDGGGVSPPKYDIRVAESPIQWGSAPSFDDAFQGTTISGTEEVEITGLNPGTPYQVRLVPYRGTLGNSPVFGELSNVANGSTDAGAVAAPDTPTITAGSVTASGVAATTSAFVGASGESGHASTTWQIDVDGGDFSSPIWEETSATKLVSHPNAGASVPLMAETAYDIRAIHNGELGGASSPSVKDDFTTAAVSPGEPDYTSVGTEVYDEDFESYANATALKAAYSTNESHGVIELVGSGGQGDNGQYFNAAWDDYPGPSDANVVLARTYSLSGVTEYGLLLYFKVSPTGYIWTKSGANTHKFFLIWRSGGSSGRITLSADGQGASSFYDPNGQMDGSDIYPTRWGITFAAADGHSGLAQHWNGFSWVSSAGKSYMRQHLNISTKGPYALRDGNWHKMTLRLKEESSADAFDGIIQMWIDGVAVMDINGGDSGNPYGAYQRGATKRLSLFHHFQYPANINKGAQQNQDLSFDNVRLVRV